MSRFIYLFTIFQIINYIQLLSGNIIIFNLLNYIYNKYQMIPNQFILLFHKYFRFQIILLFKENNSLIKLLYML